jgi:hypothetical protein
MQKICKQNYIMSQSITTFVQGGWPSQCRAHVVDASLSVHVSVSYSRLAWLRTKVGKQLKKLGDISTFYEWDYLGANTMVLS